MPTILFPPSNTMRTYNTHTYKPIYKFMDEQTPTQKILDLLKVTKGITGYFLDENGNRENEIVNISWNPDSTDEEEMPDMVIWGDNASIFHEELEHANFSGNTITIANTYQFILN